MQQVETSLSKDDIVKNLKNLSTPELLSLEKAFYVEISNRDKTRTKEARNAMNEAIKAYGFRSIDEVLAQPKEANKAAIKYRNIDNPEQTWTGRGKKPTWLNQALSQGYNLSDFSVQGA